MSEFIDDNITTLIGEKKNDKKQTTQEKEKFAQEMVSFIGKDIKDTFRSAEKEKNESNFKKILKALTNKLK